MSVGTAPQAHAPSKTDESKERDARAETILTERHEPKIKDTRLDLSADFMNLSSAVSDFANLAGIAGLVRDYLLRQKIPGEQVAGFTVLHLTEGAIGNFDWIVDQLGHFGRQANEACEKLEDLFAEQDIRVREPHGAEVWP